MKKLHNKADQAAHLMKNLAHPARLMIVCRLHTGECSVGDLESITHLKQSALSQHLARLRQDKIVKTRRDGQTIFYRLTDSKSKTMIEALHGIFCSSSRS